MFPYTWPLHSYFTTATLLIHDHFTITFLLQSALMTGRWKMKWTTEKEILFCIEKGLFGLACSDVYQTIDAAAGTN
jgi:hypothetical protein